LHVSETLNVPPEVEKIFLKPKFHVQFGPIAETSVTHFGTRSEVSDVFYSNKNRPNIREISNNHLSVWEIFLRSNFYILGEIHLTLRLHQVKMCILPLDIILRFV